MKKMLKSIVAFITPTRSLNIVSSRNIAHLGALVTSNHDRPKILVVGGRIVGQGMKHLLESPSFSTFETDLQFGPRTQVLCDAHLLPFPEGTFDAVVIQAVLEHVVEPGICVQEIWRILGTNGLVYAETPFLQQVHGSPFDFQRFTYLGHRRLFRHFEEIETGPVAGPGTVLTWAWEFFVTSFSDRPTIRAVLRRIALMTGGWAKHFDRVLLAKEGAWESASAYYFLGRKSEHVLKHDDLLKSFRN